MQPDPIETDVLIAGAGPAGQTASLLLAQGGVRTITLSRHTGPANAPRAHYQNQRSMEILRELGLDGRVLEAARDETDARYVVWTETLSGREFGRITMYAGESRSDYVHASPTRAAHIPQHDLERILADAAAERQTDLRWGHVLTDFEQDEDGVTSTILIRETGATYRVRSAYLIGADGARSLVAETLGVDFDGPAGWGAAVNVWFRADLSAHTAHRPGALYWTNRPGADFWLGSGGFISIRPWDEWMLSFMYDPAQGEPDYSTEALTERIRSLVGDDAIVPEILSVNPWQMNAQVARRMRGGRVFIMGDAAHRHPPSGGLGSNVSMQDAHNLAWKIRAVIEGWAGESLLDSYEAERLPEAAQVVARTMGNIERTAPLNRALGFEPGQTAESMWSAYAELGRPGSEGDARRRELRAALALQHEHFSALGEDLGRPYPSGAFVPDDAGRPAEPKTIEFVPSSAPGNRLPHAWLDRGSVRSSTLDLVSDRGLTMFVGVGGDPWIEAARSLGAPLSVVRVGLGLEDPEEWRDLDGAWSGLREVGENGALVVRPDRIVAYRAAEAMPDAQRALSDAVDSVLSPTEKEVRV